MTKKLNAVKRDSSSDGDISEDENENPEGKEFVIVNRNSTADYNIDV